LPALSPRRLRLRKALVLLISVLVPFLLVRVGGHRGVHMARNLLFPGMGVVDHQPGLAALFGLAAIAATVLWVRWGAGWLLIVVLVATTAVSGLFPSGPAGGPASVEKFSSAHEFPLVILVMGAVLWGRSIVGRVPGVRLLTVGRHRRREGLRELGSLGPVERCQAVAILALAGAGTADLAAAIGSVDVYRRARWIGAVARLRFRGDPFRRDHAHARSARLLTGVPAGADAEGFNSDASRTTLGVPCSEPTWIRPLDATLAAVALERAGMPNSARAWEAALNGPFGLRRGHRPAWWWTPLDIGTGASPAWEHAAFTWIARACGWVDNGDWPVLRARAMGAAARGVPNRNDERLVAAGRVWLAFVDDPEAERIVRRPGIRRDPLACALDRLASRLWENPAVLRGSDVNTRDMGDRT